MLQFTPAGAVDDPTMLQIRVGRHYPDRIAAGAPIPSRDLTDVEISENIRAFTVQRRGPRTRPCTGLLLSGVSGARLQSLGPVLRQAREWGIETISAHLTGEWRPEHLLRVDRLAIISREVTLPEVERMAAIADKLTVVIPLEASAMAVRESVCLTWLKNAHVRVVLTWPFPPLGAPAPLHEVRGLLARLPVEASGPRLVVKGIPQCLLEGHPVRSVRTRNRWYVDVSHQGSNAKLFHPDIVQYEKVDACRHCAVLASCDGVAHEWAERRALPLRPLSSPNDCVQGS